MSWLKIDDEFIDHPKVYAAADALGSPHNAARVVAVYVAGLTYASRHRTDGALSQSVVARFAIDAKPLEVALALVDARLWEQTEDGGFMIHDYLEHNPSAQQVADRREYQRVNKAKSRQRQHKGDTRSAARRQSTDQRHSVPRARAVPHPDPNPHPNTPPSPPLGADGSARVCRLLEVFARQHGELRGPYVAGRTDADHATRLIATYTDSELAAMVDYWLTCKANGDEYLESARTLPKFAARATWVYDRLTAQLDRLTDETHRHAMRAVARDSRKWLETAAVRLTESGLEVETPHVQQLEPARPALALAFGLELGQVTLTHRRVA